MNKISANLNSGIRQAQVEKALASFLPEVDFELIFVPTADYLAEVERVKLKRGDEEDYEQVELARARGTHRSQSYANRPSFAVHGREHTVLMIYLSASEPARSKLWTVEAILAKAIGQYEEKAA